MFFLFTLYSLLYFDYSIVFDILNGIFNKHMVYLVSWLAYLVFLLAYFFTGMAFLVSKSFGMVYLLHEMARAFGIWDDVHGIFIT